MNWREAIRAAAATARERQHHARDTKGRFDGPLSEVEPAQAECRHLRDLLYAIIDGRVTVVRKKKR